MTLSDDDLVRAVTAIVARAAERPAEELAPDADLRADLGIDSLLGLQIVAMIEKEFDFEVPDDQLDQFTTIREIAAGVRAHGGA